MMKMGAAGSIVTTIFPPITSIFGDGSSSSSKQVPIAYALPGSELRLIISQDTRVLVPATTYNTANYQVLSALGDNKDILVYGTAAVLLYVVLKK
jgi:hypothetical protein